MFAIKWLCICNHQIDLVFMNPKTHVYNLVFHMKLLKNISFICEALSATGKGKGNESRSKKRDGDGGRPAVMVGWRQLLPWTGVGEVGVRHQL